MLILEVKSNLIGQSSPFALDGLLAGQMQIFMLHTFLLRYQVALLADVQDHHCPSDLDALLALRPDLHVQVVLLDQRAELRLVVVDVEARPVELYDRVVAGHGDVGDSDFAVVAAAELDASLGDVLDHHDALGLLAGSLQDEVVALGLFDGQQLDGPVVRRLDDDWQLRLADLALELLEVVVERAADHLLLDLDADPLQQALQVHRPAGARAPAGIEQEVVLLLRLLQADLAGTPLFSLGLALGGVVLHGQPVGADFLFGSLGSHHVLAHRDLAHEKLDSADLDGLSGL